MKTFFLAFILVSLGIASKNAHSQQVVKDIPYGDGSHDRQVLDVYTREANADALKPVVFWIHGGGWQVGDKSNVALKPKVLTERGFVFVSTNYRLLPDVEMDVLIRDVAQAIGWVHRNISTHGGDPNRMIIGGHSAGAQLAALLCTDHRYLNEQHVPATALVGCVSVDGDTYDIPKIIMTAEHRQALYERKMFTFGHRQKFGNDPDKHIEFSAVTHISKGKPIPPFLILYFSGNPDTTVQAQRLTNVLKESAVPVTVYGKSDTNHRQLNDELGMKDDPATEKLFQFLDALTSSN